MTEARARQKAGEQPGSDTWRADLDPRTAARARTVPLLTEERDRLRAELAEVKYIADLRKASHLQLLLA